MRLLAKILGILVIALGLLAIIFSVPAVQTRSAQLAINWFNDQYGTELRLERFRYNFPNELIFNNLHLPDEQGDTLIYAQNLEFYFGGFSRVSNQLVSNGVALDKLRFRLITYPGDSLSNFDRFLAKLRNDQPDTSSTTPFSLNIAELVVSDGNFHLEDLNCPQECYRMDYQDLDLEAQDFSLEGSQVGVEFKSGSFHDRYGLDLQKLQGRISYADSGIFAQQLHLITNRSEIQGDLALAYDDRSALQNFVEEVELDVSLDYSLVHSRDLQVYAANFPNFERIALAGRFQGPIQDLDLQDLDLGLGQNTRLQADLRLRDPTQPDSLWLSSPNLNLQTNPEDIQQLTALFQELSWPPGLQDMGLTRLQGSYEGYLENFHAQLQLKNELVDLETDLHLAHLASPEKAVYRGAIQVRQLEVGQLLGKPLWGGFQADLSLDGKGFVPQSMRTRMDGSVSQFKYRGYQYDSLTIHGNIAEGAFAGKLNLQDPHVAFNFEGKASFGSDTSSYDFQARLDTAQLHALHFSSDSLAELSAQMDIDFKALNFDRWQGQVRIQDVAYNTSRSNYMVRLFDLVADGFGREKSIRLESSLLDGELWGNYTLAGVAQTFRQALQKYNANPENPAPDTLGQEFRYKLELKNVAALMEVLAPNWYLEPGISLSGKFDSTQQQLTTHLEVPAARNPQYFFRDFSFHYQGDWEQSSSSLALGSVELSSGYLMDSLELRNRFREDSLQYQLKGILRDSIDARLYSAGKLHQSSTQNFFLGLDSTSFNIGKENFAVDPQAQLRLDSGRVHLRDIVLRNDRDDRVTLEGILSDHPHEILRVNMHGIGMEVLNYFLADPSLRFHGKLQGNIIANQLLGKPRFMTDLQVDSLRINQYEIGNLDLQTNYNPFRDTLYIQSKVERGELETITVDGYLEARSEGAVDMEAQFNRFRVNALNPVVASVAENLRGLLEGNLRLRGTMDDLNVDGVLSLPKVAFTVGFLQTDYNFTGDPQVYFEKGQIRFPRLELRDTEFGTEGILKGAVQHQNFQDFKLDLTIAGKELLVLNTPPGRGDAYYGTAFAGGEINLRGDPARLKVDAQVSTQRKTNFSIPIAGSAEERRSGYVEFINPQAEEDSLEIENVQFMNDEGVSLDFDIAVDQRAAINIILDAETGNKMQAQGDGQIKLKMDPFGEMQLFGLYTIAQGSYNFNLEGMFNKRFELQRGGTVNWNGDPYQAQLDITAKYITKADPSVFTGQPSAGPTRTEVYLQVSGPLTNPEINFDIKTPRSESSRQALLSNRLANEEAMNQQVFSLLALNSFTPASNVFSGSSGGINEWDILANQAAAFLNRFTGDYELSLSYQQGNQQTGTAVGGNDEELEVGVSKDFFNERLSVNSSVGVPLNNNSQNSLAGDFEVEYNLTRDGRLRARAFNRAVESSFNVSLGQQQLYQQGLGISYRVDVDRVNKLWQRIFQDKAVREEEEQEQPSEEPTPPEDEAASETKETE